MPGTRSHGVQSPSFPDTSLIQQVHEGVLPTAKNVAIVSVEFPALEIYEHFSIELSDSAKQQQTLLESLVEALHDVVGGGWNALAEAFDMNSTKEKLDHLRLQGLHALEQWRKKLRAADEGLARADGAKATMNSMRDAYFKELQHLKEQLHQKEKARKTGIEFQPDAFTLFDATDFCFDPEYVKIANEKFQQMENRWSEKYEEQQRTAEEKLRVLTDQLASARLRAERQEQLLQQLRERHCHSSAAEMQQASGKKGGEKQEGLFSKAGQTLGRAKESALQHFRVKPSMASANEVLAFSSRGSVSSDDANMQSPKKNHLLNKSSFAKKVFLAGTKPLCFDAPVPDQPSEHEKSRRDSAGRTIQFKELPKRSSLSSLHSSSSMDSAGEPQTRPKKMADSLRAAFRRSGTWSASVGKGQNNESHRSKNRESGCEFDDAGDLPPSGFDVSSAISLSTKEYQDTQMQSDLGGWMVEETLRFWHERQDLMKSMCDIGVQAQASCETVGIQCALSLPEAEPVSPIMDHCWQESQSFTMDHLNRQESKSTVTNNFSRQESKSFTMGHRSKQESKSTTTDNPSRQESKGITMDNFNMDALSRHRVSSAQVEPASKRYTATPTKSNSNAPRRQTLVKGSPSKVGSSMSLRGGTNDLQAVDLSANLEFIADDLKSLAVRANVQDDEYVTTPAAKLAAWSPMTPGEKPAMTSAVAKNLVKPDAQRTARMKAT